MTVPNVIRPVTLDIAIGSSHCLQLIAAERSTFCQQIDLDSTAGQKCGCHGDSRACASQRSVFMPLGIISCGEVVFINNIIQRSSLCGTWAEETRVPVRCWTSLTRFASPHGGNSEKSGLPPSVASAGWIGHFLCLQTNRYPTRPAPVLR